MYQRGLRPPHNRAGEGARRGVPQSVCTAPVRGPVGHLLRDAAKDVVLVGGERVRVCRGKGAHLEDELAAEPVLGVDVAAEDGACDQIRSVGLADSCTLGQRIDTLHRALVNYSKHGPVGPEKCMNRGRIFVAWNFFSILCSRECGNPLSKFAALSAAFSISFHTDDALVSCFWIFLATAFSIARAARV